MKKEKYLYKEVKVKEILSEKDDVEKYF